VIEAEARVAERRRALDAAVTARDDAAADLGIAAWVADLRALETAIGGYRQALAALWPTIRNHGVACTQAARTAEDAAEAATAEGHHAAVLLETRTRRRRRSRSATRCNDPSAPLEEILQRLADARSAGCHAGRRLESTRRRTARRRSARRSRREVEAERRTLDEDAGRRDAAVAALRTLAAARFLDVAQTGSRRATRPAGPSPARWRWPAAWRRRSASMPTPPGSACRRTSTPACSA
jgi:hypothetical protein